MEYDPASPTDEYELKGDVTSVQAIPLPVGSRNLDHSFESVSEICDAEKVQNIPLPPPPGSNLGSIPMPPDIPSNIASRVPPPPSTNHNNVEEAILSFRIKGGSKRSRPAILRTGVLPTKVKHPEVETKTELFKPSKEDELEVMAEINNDPILLNQPPSQPSLAAISEAILARISAATQSGQGLAAALRDVNKLTYLHGLAIKPTDLIQQIEPKNEITKSENPIDESKHRTANLVGVSSAGPSEVVKHRSRSQTPQPPAQRSSRTRSPVVKKKKARSPSRHRRSLSSSRSSSSRQDSRQRRWRRSSSRATHRRHQSRSRRSRSHRISRSPVNRRRRSPSSRGQRVSPVASRRRRSRSRVGRHGRDRSDSRRRRRGTSTQSMSSDYRRKKRVSRPRRCSVDKKNETRGRSASKKRVHSLSSSSSTRSSSSSQPSSRGRSVSPPAKRSRKSETPQKNNSNTRKKIEGETVNKRPSGSLDSAKKSLSSSKGNKTSSKPKSTFQKDDGGVDKKTKSTAPKLSAARPLKHDNKPSTSLSSKKDSIKADTSSHHNSKKIDGKKFESMSKSDFKSKTKEPHKSTEKSSVSASKSDANAKKPNSSNSKKSECKHKDSNSEQKILPKKKSHLKTCQPSAEGNAEVNDSTGERAEPIHAGDDASVAVKIDSHDPELSSSAGTCVFSHKASVESSNKDSGGGPSETPAAPPPVTQECTVPQSMTLDDRQTGGYPSVLGPTPSPANNSNINNNSNNTKSSYSSTASTSCRTPLSVSSTTSSNECVNLSPKRPNRKGEVGGRKRHRAVVFGHASDDDDDDDSNGDEGDDGSNSRYRLRLRRRKIGDCSANANGTPAEEACPVPSVDLFKLLQPFETLPIQHFAELSGVACPQYQHVLENDYSRIEEQLRREGGLETTTQDPSLLRHHGGGGDWVCDCAIPPSPPSGAVGELACGHGCINRALYIECGSRCPAHFACSNRQFQRRLYAPTEPFFCGPEKGWGLRALQTIPKGAFIVEYAGEVIDFPEFRRRIRMYEKARQVHHYFMALGPEHFIDAGTKGNWARFVNHSCEPNAETQKWMVNGRIRIGFFALSEISANEEITIDYQFVQYGLTQQNCYCETPSCSGIMGATSKSLQDKVRLKDTRMVERRIVQLLSGKELQTAEDVTFLIQVMVQEYLTRYTRMELLKLLANTDNESYLKLFRQYNGLELLASYMCDTAPSDWEIKFQILVCLDHIPVSEQKQVQTDSSLMEIVRQWTLDPHYSRSRSRFEARPTSSTGVSASSACPGDTFSIKTSSKQSPSSINLQLSSYPAGNDDGVTKMSMIIPTPSDSTSNETSKSAIAKAADGCTLPPNSQLVINARNAKEDIDDFTGQHPPAAGVLQIEEAAEEVKDGTHRHLLVKLHDANTIRVYSLAEEATIISEIRQLSSQILDRWSKLPVETYRIPRLEREATEQSILQSSRSALTSWGVSSPKDDTFTFWSFISKDSGSNRSPNSASANSTKAESSTIDSCSGDRKGRQHYNHSRHHNHHNHRKLTRSEHRAQLEAAEAAAASSIQQQQQQQSQNSPDANELLLKNLTGQIFTSGEKNTAIQLAMSVLSEKLREFTNKNDTQGLVTYLQSLADETNSSSTKSKTSASSVSTLQPRLEPPWCSAVDAATGITYYYNSVTRVVQWEPPPTSDGHPLAENPQNQEHGQLKKDFLSEVYACVIRLLKPFRLPNCLTGRIENDDDMKYIAKKFALTLGEKQKLRFGDQEPCLTRETVEHFRRKITRYLTSKGKVYVRSRPPPPQQQQQQQQQHQSDPSGSELVDCDMEIDDE